MKIDLNADLGESFGPYEIGDDAAMLDIVSSANVACGFHGGDPAVMAATVQACVERGVSIGAHPGFRDLEGFGRRRIEGMEASELESLVLYQIGALQAVARASGGAVTHVKLHGALANMASEDEAVAEACLGAVSRLGDGLRVITMAATALERSAQRLGLVFAREIYADRAYRSDGTLVARSEPGAVLHDAESAAARVLAALQTGTMTSIDGDEIEMSADTVCVHGDHPESVTMAATLRARLEEAGYTVAPF